MGYATQAPPDDAWRLHLAFDGGGPGRNGGPATWAWQLRLGNHQGPLLAEQNGTHDGASSNLAEWTALERSLLWLTAVRMPIHHLFIRGDSKLVIDQLCGDCRTNAEHLRLARDHCRGLLDAIGCSWSSRWVSREANSQADKLARDARRKPARRPWGD